MADITTLKLSQGCNYTGQELPSSLDLISSHYTGHITLTQVSSSKTTHKAHCNLPKKNKLLQNRKKILRDHLPLE